MKRLFFYNFNVLYNVKGQLLFKKQIFTKKNTKMFRGLQKTKIN